MTDQLTATSILAEATRVLLDSGYRQADSGARPFMEGLARVFEDRYGIVGVVVYDTWESLRSGWPNAQGALVEIMSASLGPAEPKAWEGYLVLFTPASPSPDAALEPLEIRRDTVRLRKLVATGEELSTLEAVGDALLPLLPLASASGRDSGEDVLDLLPAALAPEIEEATTRRLIEAFRRNEPLMEQLHRGGGVR